MTPGLTACPAHAGHPIPFVRRTTGADQVNEQAAHRQSRTAAEPAPVAVAGISFVSAYSAAMSGRWEARSLTPAMIVRFAHTGQRLVFLRGWERLAGVVVHVPWRGSREQRHTTILFDPATTWSGRSPPLSRGSQSSARLGNWEAKSLTPGRTWSPAQTGQPIPRADRWYGVAL